MTVLKFPSSENLSADILQHYMKEVDNIEQMAVIVKDKEGRVAISYNVVDRLNMLGLLEVAKLTLIQELLNE